MKQFTILLFIFFFGINTHAQTQLSPQTQEGYNAYAELANDYMHALWSYRVDLGRLNFKVLEYLNIDPLQRNANLKYKHTNFLETLTFNIEPKHAYNRAFDVGENIPSQHQIPLNNSIQQMKQSMDSLVEFSRQIETYIEDRKYEKEENLKTLFDLLDKCEAQFEAFRAANISMISTLENAQKFHQENDNSNEYLRHADQLKSIIAPARQVLYALRENSIEAVQDARRDLDLAIELISEIEAESLSKPIEGKSYEGVYVRYDHVLKLATYISTYVQKYTTADVNTSRYTMQSPNYYYYNREILQQFNRVGNGLVLQYNIFVDASPTRFIKMTEEPHWYKVRNIDDTSIAPGELEMDIDSLSTDSTVAAISALEGYAPNNLIFLLDVSQSMNTSEKLDLLKSSFKHLVSEMRPEDKIGIVTFSGAAKVVLEPTSSTEKELIYKTLESLRPSGKSEIESGFREAYGVLNRYYLEGGNNKIILATDGDFETYKRIINMIGRHKNEGKTLSVFYYAKEKNNSIGYRLRQFAEAGGGRYAYIQAENANEIIIKEAQKTND